MDKEWQIRLNFLDEAEEYFDKMESNLLGLGTSAVDPKKVDVILRAAHSIKGGAAMMGFLSLSRAAHRIEDFLKILRVRYAGESIDIAVETLLLQSIDSLRQLGTMSRQGQNLSNEDLEQTIQLLFDQLQGYLGDLEESDEDALMNQVEDVDPALLLFEDGVESILAEFEVTSQSASIDEIPALLKSTAQELIAFGNMANLDSFCQLCQSIDQLASHTSSETIESLRIKALKSWKRSHSLVLRGSLDKLPTHLEGFESPHHQDDGLVTASDSPGTLEIPGNAEMPVEELQVDSFDIADIDPSSFDTLMTEVESTSMEPLDAFDVANDFEPVELGAIDSALESSESIVDDELNHSSKNSDPLMNLDLEEIGLLQDAFSEVGIDTNISDVIDKSLEPDDSSPEKADITALGENSLEATESLRDSGIPAEEFLIDSFDIADLDLSSFGTLIDEVESKSIEPLESFDSENHRESSDSILDSSPLIVDGELNSSNHSSVPLNDQDSTDLAESNNKSLDALVPESVDHIHASTSEQDQEKASTDSDLSQNQSLIPEQTKDLLEGICQRLALDPSILYALIDQQAPTMANVEAEKQNTTIAEKMVRVPASQLKQFNSLFEQLILNRNSINLKLQQFQTMIQLMGQRVTQIETSNVQLKQWYDRASMEGFLNYSDDRLGRSQPQSQNKELFDSLEMDRYSDIHLICQAQIETIVQLQEVATDIQLGLSDISQSVDTLNYTTQSMQGNVTRTQMIPFKDVVKRCPRMIRDLNLQYDKQVVLEILGETTLLDRRVADLLNDPLMHLLRNAFDHGVEDAEQRTKLGKSPEGRITIQASNQGTYTVVTIKDDGAGLPLDKIRDRITQMGIPQSDVEKISEPDLLEFIFEPGFSTAEKVTELSGRGVGMDVVKTNINEIQGNIRVSSEPGQGTTFTIRIPYTLSILRVAVVEQDGMIFAIPANAIQEMFEFDARPINMQDMIPSLAWMKSQLPVIELEKALVFNRAHQKIRLTGAPTIDKPMAIVVKNNHRHAALKVTRFWYEQESTIRPIDSPIPLPTGIISSVVFGDGKVIPLIDPSVMIDPYIEALSNPDHEIQMNGQMDSLSQSQSILIVDDSINVRRYLAHTLEKAGYMVEQAKDGQEGVERLMDGLNVNAVICDIEMPRLDGYGFLEEIKGQSQFDELPVVMLTSRSNEKHRKIAMNLGATDYFSKPYNESLLLERLANFT